MTRLREIKFAEQFQITEAPVPAKRVTRGRPFPSRKSFATPPPRVVGDLCAQKHASRGSGESEKIPAVPAEEIGRFRGDKRPGERATENPADLLASCILPLQCLHACARACYRRWRRYTHDSAFQAVPYRVSRVLRPPCPTKKSVSGKLDIRAVSEHRAAAYSRWIDKTPIRASTIEQPRFTGSCHQLCHVSPFYLYPFVVRTLPITSSPASSIF